MGIPHQSTLYISTYQIGRGFAIKSLFFINRRSHWGDQVAIAQQGALEWRTQTRLGFLPSSNA
jgi:hypothetical protein